MLSHALDPKSLEFLRRRERQERTKAREALNFSDRIIHLALARAFARQIDR